MRNDALNALWLIAGVGVAVGVVMILVGQADDPLDTPNYGVIYAGSGLVSLGVLCAVGAIVAAAVGFYVDRAALTIAQTINPPQPTPEDDARRDASRSDRFAKVAKSGGLSWTNEAQ